MLNKMRQVKRLHLIGLGGVGMSGIAQIALEQGLQISGSDLCQGPVLKRLAEQGATIALGHETPTVLGADVVVVSSAIAPDNPEVLLARQHGIPIVPRALMLAELMRYQVGIAVSGTHGKTTTTGLMAAVLMAAGWDPSFVIGGRLNQKNIQAQQGKGDYFIAEADESDASFLYLHPTLSIVTNIDADHLPTYNGDFEQLLQVFVDFIHQLPFYGLAVVCVDDPGVRQIMPRLQRPLKTYGFSEAADYAVLQYRQEGIQTFFSVRLPDAQVVDLCLNLPGRHNALNATAVLAVAMEEGVPLSAIQRAFSSFEGVGRRFQIWGSYPIPQGAGHFLMMEDYGHHPKELAATLEAVRAAWPERRVVMVYQPHRYTRTQDTFADSVAVLSQGPDVLLLMDVYGAGEMPIVGADSEALAAALRAGRAEGVLMLTPEQTAVFATLKGVLEAEDVLLFQGAGSVGALARKIDEGSLENLWHS